MTEQVYTLPAEEIIVLENRHRKEFDKKKLNDLVESFLDKGQKTPGLCERKGDTYILIFGERRLRACQEAKIPFKFLLEEDDLDPIRLEELQLEENLLRDDLTWLEQCRAVERLHALKQELEGEAYAGSSSGHGIRDTAEIVGISPTTVHEELELAQFAEVPEVANARNKTEAKKIIKRYKEEYKTSVALEEARAEADGDPPNLEFDFGEGEGGEVEEVSMKSEIAKRVKFFDPKVIRGRMEDVLEGMENETFQVVCFDPPWGVEFDQVSLDTGSTQKYEDPVESIEKLLDWLRIIYNKMHSESHLYLFFGIVHKETVYSTLEKVGFETNGIPIIWYKQGAHRTRNPDIWPGRSYEPIAYARKGKKILVRKGAPDVIITPMPTPSIKKSHPSGKHPDIYIELLKRSAMPGDKVIDPMCGSGMFGVACETMRVTHQLDWSMIEMDRAFTELALTNVVQGYHTIIHKDKTEKAFQKDDYLPDQPELPEDYKELTPKSHDWMRYWKAYPEEQVEMAKWAFEQAHPYEANKKGEE